MNNIKYNRCKNKNGQNLKSHKSLKSLKSNKGIYLYINANIFKAFLRHPQSHKHTLRSNFSELKCKSIISGIYSYLC